MADSIHSTKSDLGIRRFRGYFREGDRRMTLVIEGPEDHDGDLPLDPVQVELDADDAERVVDALS